MTDYIIQAEGVNKSFDAITAARNIDIAVPVGAVWSLIGSNGAGKTTFVNMVTGYIKPDSGRILFDGDNITGHEPRSLSRRGICRSFQIPQLCAELSVLENMLIALAIRGNRKPSFFARAQTARNIELAMNELEKFNLAALRDNRMSEISAGSRKLLDIAMAIAGHPRVVMLDEPTSGVAAEEKFPIMDLVMEVLAKEAVTILFIEHDMDIVTRYSERIVAFYDGEIIANGTPEETLSDSNVQRYVTGTVK
ncbi:ABC transporter ATP-binding protein [Chromatiales bacterium (ex Bugula neritina AB1)]|nr:ABC transporter ATP-binding protein [Chromatiales bacterium (ex Bugula neritina AB1)]